MDLIYFLLLIGPLVFAHELGHFLVAKAFRIRVLKFSLGFGPVMVGRQLGETYYQIAWIPLGGFVKFLGDDPRDEEQVPEEDRPRAWSATARWKRALVVVAGPLMSLAFPVLCYFFVFLFIRELPAPTIGQVIPGSAAAQAGLEAGDRVVSIDGERIYGFNDLRQVVSTRPGQRVDVVIVRDGQRRTLEVTPTRVKKGRFAVLDIYEEVGQMGVKSTYPASVIGVPDPGSAAARAGLRTFDLLTAIDGRPIKRWIDVEAAVRRLAPGSELRISYLRPQKTGWSFADVYVQQPEQTTIAVEQAVSSPSGLGLEQGALYIAFAVEGLPGARAGLRPGDKLVAVDGRRIDVWEQFTDAFDTSPDRAHTVTVVRGGAQTTVTVRPERYTLDDMYTGQREAYKEPGIGVYDPAVTDPPVPNANRWSRAVTDAVRETRDMIKYNAIGLWRIVEGRVSFQTIGGPIMLWKLAGTAGRQGAHSFLTLLALISVMLGLLNLLPVPVLDGGQLVVLGIEAVRRQSLTLRTREIINIVGLVLLLLLMILAFKNDIQRYWDWEDLTGLFR